MRKIGTVVGTVFTSLLLALSLGGVAHADVLAQWGHRDSYYNQFGDQLGSATGAAFRVGVVIRGIGTGSVTQMDVNVCVQPLNSAPARTSINRIMLLKNGNLYADSFPPNQHVVNAPSTNCFDMDPNEAVANSGSPNQFLGSGVVGVRMGDNSLVTVNAVSNFASLFFT